MPCYIILAAPTWSFWFLV